MAMFDLHHRFLDDFTHVVLNPLQLGRQAVAAYPVTPLVPRGVDVQPHLMPALLALAELDRQARIGLIDAALRWQQDYRRPYFSACLVSEHSTERLAHHLGTTQLLSVRDGGRFLLRFTDPRVMTQLLGILDEAQLDALMGPVAQWHWVDPTGQRRQRLSSQDPHLPLRVRASQVGPLRRVGLVNGCLQTLVRSGWPCADAVSLGRQLDDALVEATQAHGLRDEADRRLYAVQCVAMQGRPEAHPALKAALLKAEAGELSYVGACAELTHDPLGVPPATGTHHNDRLWEKAT